MKPLDQTTFNPLGINDQNIRFSSEAEYDILKIMNVYCIVHESNEIWE